MAWLKWFRNYRRDRRAEAYCLRRPVWRMRPRFTRASLQDLFSLAICHDLSWEVLCLPGGADLSSTRQAASARRRKYSSRHLVPYFSYTRASAASSVCSIFVHKNMAVDRNDTMTPPSQQSLEIHHLPRAFRLQLVWLSCNTFLRALGVFFFSFHFILMLWSRSFCCSVVPGTLAFHSLYVINHFNWLVCPV